MSDRKYLDIEEWRKRGGLQEVNRLYFNPHGQALVVTIITADEGGWDDYSNTAIRERVTKMAAALMDVLDMGDEDRAVRAAQQVLTILYPPGTVFLSGIWDDSDDPEGVVFGSWSEEDVARAEAVHEDRLRHFKARSALFFGEDGPWRAPQDPGQEYESDVEPFTYVWEPEE